jgi:protein-S-isoprenylcysteine O-methyltransferase Ste14
VDNAYLEIWKIEQDHSRTRWTVTTFFLSISFAVVGLSFDPSDSVEQTALFGISMPDIQRIIGVFIFWFGYALFRQFNRFTNFLRTQLRNMENEGLVSFTFQSEAREFMYSGISGLFSASRLMFYFGVLYTIVIVLLAVYSQKGET